MEEVPRPLPAPTWRERFDDARQPGSPVRRRVALALIPVGVVLAVIAVRWLLATPPPPIELSLPLAGAASTVPAAAPSGGSAEVAPPAPVPAAATVVVHVAGAVVRPGVYRVTGGARVADVIDAAGGVAPGADLDRINLAAPVLDGQQVHVPRFGEPSPPGDGLAIEIEGPVNLNSADEDQLDALPGIGPATAAAIVEHRERYGPFASVDGLLDVRGIGPAKLDALRDLVAV